VEQRTRELRSALVDKDLLLHEVHHRVKNNLQVVASLLHLQSAQTPDPRTREALRESESRVRAIALVHERLHQSAALANLDMVGYLEAIGQGVIRSMAGRTAITFGVEAGGVRLGADAAIPCGLIVNELVSNALKYAFPGRARGSIAVRLTARGASITLEVADDGVGLPPSVELRRVPTLGLRLVESLADQLGGTVELHRSAGTCCQIRFPAPAPTTSPKRASDEA
jgi:two-component sensor histidine kinase